MDPTIPSRKPNSAVDSQSTDMPQLINGPSPKSQSRPSFILKLLPGSVSSYQSELPNEPSYTDVKVNSATSKGLGKYFVFQGKVPTAALDFTCKGADPPHENQASQSVLSSAVPKTPVINFGSSFPLFGQGPDQKPIFDAPADFHIFGQQAEPKSIFDFTGGSYILSQEARQNQDSIKNSEAAPSQNVDPTSIFTTGSAEPKIEPVNNALHSGFGDDRPPPPTAKRVRKFESESAQNAISKPETTNGDSLTNPIDDHPQPPRGKTPKEKGWVRNKGSKQRKAEDRAKAKAASEKLAKMTAEELANVATSKGDLMLAVMAQGLLRKQALTGSNNEGPNESNDTAA